MGVCFAAVLARAYVTGAVLGKSKRGHDSHVDEEPQAMNLLYSAGDEMSGDVNDSVKRHDRAHQRACIVPGAWHHLTSK
jgi:hypothetical protein